MRRCLLLLPLLIACAEERSAAPKAQSPEDCPAATAPDVDLDDALAGHALETVSYTPPWTEARDLDLHIWYATDDESGEPTRYLDFMSDPESLHGAALAAPEGCGFPLVLYSHGYQGWAGNGSDVLRQFVRNGWIAAAPDHAGNTLTDNVEPVPLSFDMTRVTDLLASLDHLAALPSDHPLAGRINTDRVLVLGHSYGAQTAWLLSGPTSDPEKVDAACAAEGCTAAERAAFDAPVTDPRLAAVAPLDGSATGLVSPEGWATRQTPVLAMSQPGEGPATAYAEAAGEGVSWISIEGSCHETFTSTPVACDFPKDEGLSIVSTYLLAYGNLWVRDEDNGADLLSGDRVLDERVVVVP